MGSEGPAKVKSQHNEAFRFINEGLKFDEQGQTQKALQLYHKGIRSLAVGLSVYCNGSGPEWDQARELQEKMTLAKKQLKERIETLSPRNAPSAPAELLLDRTPPQNGYNASNGVMEQHTVSADGETWEDVKELLVLENSVKIFFVSEQGNVTTLSQPQTLYVYQFVNYEPGSQDAPAFLQCGAWVFPMVPGRSPVLNTEPHTYMFPDITIDPSSPASSEPRPQRAFASVGLILNPNISSMSLDRFERVLKCYADFHHYTPPQDFDQERAAMDQGRATPSAPPPYGTAATEPGPSMALVVRPSTDMEPAESQGKSWGRKVSKGIEIGAELIAWGLTKGAEVGSSLMQKGSAKLRDNLKPNQKPTEVDEKTQENIRHVKNVAGMACQVSGTVVSAVSAMTVELGRRIAPVIVDQGGKALPARMKKGADEVDGTSTMDEIVRVAVSGVRGAATVYMGLENSWKVLYKSLQYATVQTVDHKYGPAASEATNNAMGAMGYALQTYWNVDNLGIKALAKRTAKDTGKEMVKETGKKYITDGQS